MQGESSYVLTNTIQQIFANNTKELKASNLLKGKKKVARTELELALTILLVELASCDQSFDQKEYRLIAAGLRRVFGTCLGDVTALVNRAQVVTQNLRGSKQFSELLRDNISEEHKEQIIEVIDQVIMADGVEDPYETYLRHKFADALGVDLEKLKARKQKPKE
jgi:uncharacterized tellurite resistance protein B-like protein